MVEGLLFFRLAFLTSLLFFDVVALFLTVRVETVFFRTEVLLLEEVELEAFLLLRAFLLFVVEYRGVESPLRRTRLCTVRLSYFSETRF